MKHQRPDLDTLPRREILPCRRFIHERRMRHPSRASIKLTVETLDQHNFLRRLSICVEPLMFRIWSDRKRLTLTIRIDQGHRDQVSVRHAISLCDGERVAVNGFDGTPDVDDLVAGFEQLISEIGQVMGDAGFGGAVGLVDVDSIDWAAERLRWVAHVFLGAADGVVEDEDAAGSSPAVLSIHGLVGGKKEDSRIFEQLLCLGIVLSLYLLVVKEVLLPVGMWVDLEAAGIESM